MDLTSLKHLFPSVLLAMPKINWTAINAKLPIAKNSDQKAKRKAMFRKFDPNGNGILSLSEVDKAMRDVLRIDALFDAKPAIMRAFQIAKDCTKSKRSDGVGADYIEFREFRYFLLSLRQYFEYYAAFARSDAGTRGFIITCCIPSQSYSYK